MTEDKLMLPGQGSLAMLPEVVNFSKVAVESGMFPDIKSQAQAVIRIMRGAELGLPPLYSLEHVLMINNKLALDAGAMANLVKRSGRYDYRIVRLDNQVCELEFFDSGTSMGKFRFSAEDAKTAGLGGQSWQKYPRNMLFARCLSNAARWNCPHVIGGAYTPEELSGPARPPEVVEVVEETTGEIVESVTTPPAPVSKPNGGAGRWTKFWLAVHRLGLSDDQAHADLGVTSMKDWEAGGFSIDDAILKLEKIVKQREAKAKSQEAKAAGQQAVTDLFGEEAHR